MKASTGLRNKLLDNGSLKSIFANGFIKIYTGAAPASADDAVTGTLLCTISEDATGTGINFAAAAAGGVLSKDASEIWRGVNVAGGTAGYMRHVAAGDDGTSSTTQARMQGTVGLAGADLNLSNVLLVNGASQSIDYYNAALPTA
jgi:hypothetical protein